MFICLCILASSEMAFSGLWKRRSLKFEPVSPQTRYTVTYLGHEEMKGKVGLDNTLKPVEDLYKRFKKLKSPSRMEIEVVNNGIRVVPLDAGVRTMFANSPYFVAEGPFGNVFFPINKLSFGAADPFHTKVFCFVSLKENPAQDNFWDCHAVVCESSAMAKNLTLYLVKAFQRIANSKGNPITGAQRNNKTTTVHIIHERSHGEHQRKGKRPPVATLKVTLNVEERLNLEDTGYNDNRKVSGIIAKHRSVNLSNVDNQMVLGGDEELTTNVNSVSKAVGTSSSDKENDLMEGVDDCNDMPQEIVVTVAVNPDLNSPPNSPRKSPSPLGGIVISGKDDDVGVHDGNTSPQEMITTMSPPDTPGYLSKEEKSPLPTPTTTSNKNKPPSPKRQGSSSNLSSRKKGLAPSPPSTKTPVATNISSSPRQSPPKSSPPRKQDDKSDDSKRRKAPSPSAKKDPITPTIPSQQLNTDSSFSSQNVPSKSNSSPKADDNTSGVVRRQKLVNNSPPSSSSSSSRLPSTSATTDHAAQEKMKKRKSVRFADAELVID